MEDVDSLLKKLTVLQKIRMLSGKDFWRTQDYPELGVDSLEVADGPYGVRKQTGLCDHMGWNKSVPATAYVSGPGLAASFDADLARETGKHLAAEARKLGVDILLGPAVNIVRTPLCGRNFEYYSEDPVLAGEMAASYVDGVQSQGVGTCIKHFAANNQEVDREYIDAIVDERTLREIYLKVFEIAIRKAEPWAVMTALNKVNGNYCSENPWLIDKVLRKEWKYEGLVMSDWSGVNDRERALKSGLDLEMPYSYGVSEKRLMDAYEAGSLSEDDIDEGCRHILTTLGKVLEGRKIVPEYTDADHDAFARTMAEKTAVLLKNDDGILPLKKGESILVCGDFAINPRFKMEGSALVNPTRFDIPLEEIEAISDADVCFERCYKDDASMDEQSLAAALSRAAVVDKVVVFAGLPSGIEAEGKDRKDIFMPTSHVRLITEIAQVNPNVVVVLLNGSPVDLGWDSSAKGVLEMFLAGQCLGSAVARLLFGLANPGGKLPVSFPYRIEHTPAYLNYPGFSGKVRYAEEVFVGYRYYLSKHIETKYPFGYGLSYTTFELKNAGVDVDGNDARISVDVSNTGNVYGSEVVQIYVIPPFSRIPRPVKELKAFRRVYAAPGETVRISFNLCEKDYEYFDPDLGNWYAAEGIYRIAVGTSCIAESFGIDVRIVPSKPKFEEITGWSSIGSLRATPAGKEAIENIRHVLIESGNEQALKFPLVSLEEKDEAQVDKIPLRMITVLTDNIVNNDIMDEIISTVNRKNLECIR